MLICYQTQGIIKSQRRSRSGPERVRYMQSFTIGSRDIVTVRKVICVVFKKIIYYLKGYSQQFCVIVDP
jgi:hypothetical protein